ncbi:hypothetical protein N665_0830s0017 [Sinapis alba]|nr:hypothetical protein N665_0830s0017 [Sinapis alba]
MKTLFPFPPSCVPLLITYDENEREKSFDHVDLTKEFFTEIFGILSTSSVYKCVSTFVFVSGGGYTANRDLLGFLCKTPHDLMMYTRCDIGSW